MNEPLTTLLTILQLEDQGADVFDGANVDLGLPAVYGGQVLGQALSAATRTVASDRLVHSMHAYFLRPGNKSLPIRYEVERIRDGRTFVTRRIVALQNGEPIFNMSASFCSAEAGFEHQATCPEVPSPELIADDLVLARRHREKIPTSMREQFTRDQPFEIRSIVRVDPFNPKPMAPVRTCWLRATDRLPDDPHVHRSLLAYISDYGFLGTCLNPHGTTIFDNNLHVASLDHAIWFHRPFRVDEWLLYSIDSPNASAAKGFCRGEIFKQDGTLVASVAQEGLIRPQVFPKKN